MILHLFQHMSGSRILQYTFLHGLLYQKQLQCTILNRIVLCWATCRFCNVCGFGNVEQNNGQTWRPSSMLNSIHVMSACDIKRQVCGPAYKVCPKVGKDDSMQWRHKTMTHMVQKKGCLYRENMHSPRQIFLKQN